MFASLVMLKTHLDMVLGNLLWVALLELGASNTNSSGPSPAQPFCDFVKLCHCYPNRNNVFASSVHCRSCKVLNFACLALQHLL